MAARVSDNGQVLLDAYREHRRPLSAMSARSRRRRSGWSIIFTSSKNRFARFATICRADTIGSCPSLPTARWKGIRAFSESRGPTLRILTAISIRRRCPSSCRRISASNRLTIGELWAVAITLRIVLVENLRRAAPNRLAAAVRSAPRPISSPTGCSAPTAARPRAAEDVFKDFDPSPVPAAFAVQLVQRLRDQDPQVTPALRVARRAPRGAGNHGRRDRPPSASGARRDERHGPQRDHQHAPDVGGRLGGILREREPGRCGAARGQRLCRDGFCHARSLSARDRKTRARFAQN